MEEREVFISHHYGDRQLTLAWKKLLVDWGWKSDNVWFSSDSDPRGGLAVGEWSVQVRNRLAGCKYCIVLLTPSSNTRPWIHWETGLAFGLGKVVVPVFHFMKAEDVHQMFNSLQSFCGDKDTDVRRLCGLLSSGTTPPRREVPQEAMARFLHSLPVARRESVKTDVFFSDFHTHGIARKMEGRWYAAWTQLNPSGDEVVFERDTLDFVAESPHRIRALGRDTKSGLKELNHDGLLDHYPMEGVVSRAGVAVLSYWSAGEFAYCGNVIVEPADGTGQFLTGRWHGHEGRHLNHKPELVEGCVGMARERAKVDSWLSTRTTATTLPTSGQREFDFDVFLSTPMAGYPTDDQYAEAHRGLRKVYDALKDCGLRVFWAANNIESASDFQPGDVAAEGDLNAVKRSRFFVLIFDSPLLSSVIFESGYALALGRSSRYFVRNRQHLPFLMRNLRSPDVHIHAADQWEDYEDLARKIERFGKAWFSEPRSS